MSPIGPAPGAAGVRIARLDMRAALALVPVLLLLHNLEEAVAMWTLGPELFQRAPALLQELAGPDARRLFFGALAFATALPLALLLWPGRERRGSAAVFLLLAVQATVALNVLSHLAGAIALRGYSPGLATALAINAPFSWYLLRRAWREQWLGRRAMAWLAPAALVIHGPLLLSFFAASRLMLG